MNDYVIKRKEIVDKLIKDANMLKKEGLFEEDMIRALIEIMIEDNEKYFIKDGENPAEGIKKATVEIMNIIKKELYEENRKDEER